MRDRGRGVVRAFFSIVLVAFVVLGIEAWQISTARDLTNQNHTLIRRIAEQSQTQASACANFETLKGAVNDFHRTLQALLRTAIQTDLKRARTIRSPKLKAADLTAVRQLRKLRRHIRTVKASCDRSTADGR